MAFRLSASSIEKAIGHLCRYGDTDVFPHLLELAFFRDESVAIVDELQRLDLDSYSPGGAIEALTPKNRYGFRIAHQLGAVDTVLLLAAVIEIGSKIEARRPPPEGIEAFSYRFSEEDGESLFLAGRTYKDWLHAQHDHIQGNLKVKHIIKTDISDFYARINFHRLENLLDDAAPRQGAARYIKKAIKTIRLKQSFGLPVGGSASRLLAELAISDIDKTLINDDISATRFVDDFRIFLHSRRDPYEVLSFLAKHLGVSEGLTLNASKTNVCSRFEFLSGIEKMITDISQKAESDALEGLTADIYFDDAPDVSDIERLKALNLLGFLQEEIDKESYDMGRIKVIFRALKIARPTEAMEYILENFSELTIFAKEITLLMQALEEEKPGCFDDLTQEVISVILAPSVSNVQWIRTWLMELFVRGVVPIKAQQLKKIEKLSSVLDKRQLHIIRNRSGRKQHFFRENKNEIRQMPPFEQSAFICGAVCLPNDEYKNWLTVLKPIFSDPTGNLFLQWLKGNKDDIISKITSVPTITRIRSID